MNRSRGAARRLRERDIHRRVDIVAAAAARQRIGSALSKTESVVHRARRRISEDAISLGDLLEQSPSALIPEADIRRILPREGAGDLYVTIRVAIPDGSDARTDELVRDLERLMPLEPRSGLETFCGGATRS